MEDFGQPQFAAFGLQAFSTTGAALPTIELGGGAAIRGKGERESLTGRRAPAADGPQGSKRPPLGGASSSQG
jgi:hypothetical protein